MLADEKAIKSFEKVLKSQGIIGSFEKANGRIKNYMMIIPTTVPDDIEIEMHEGDYAFLGTFSFCDTAVGAVINAETKQINGDVWLENQRDDAKEPEYKWIEFFVKTAISSIGSDGSVGCPIYTFISDRSSFTIAPKKQ